MVVYGGFLALISQWGSIGDIFLILALISLICTGAGLLLSIDKSR